MAFIEKKNPIVLNIKLTSKGRELLSKGQLDFKYYAVGDSEVDYKFNAEVQAVDSEYSAFDSSILQPVDTNPNQISLIPKNVSGDPYNLLTTVPMTAYSVENQVESLGFFTNSGNTYITDSNHVKQPDAMVNMSTVHDGGKVLSIIKAPTYGTSGEEPAVGDILYVKWTISADTTGHTVNKDYPTPNLFYRIDGITGTSLAAGLQIEVDRPLPNFSGLTLTDVKAGVMIYYNEISFTGSSVFNLSPTDYIDDAVLSFLENSQCPTVVFPYWNMSIVYSEEIGGVLAGSLKYTQFKNRKFGSFISYIQNQAPVNKKLGVIHYTNSSPANVYGEGFLLKTPVLDIPTIMWHNSSTKTLGTKLTPLGTQQLLAGLNLNYYDLADPEGLVVGKVFPELKLFVIEDQELLYTMEYKSNRSWSLPDYNAGTVLIPTAPTGITVTWTQPVICGSAQPVTLECTEYCHSTQPWTTFTNSISVLGATNTGYRVCVSNISYGTETQICAYDIADSCCACYGCAECDSYNDYNVSIGGVTNSKEYYFSGCIQHCDCT